MATSMLTAMSNRTWDTRVPAIELAAAAILRKSSRGMTVRELTERMTQRGLVKLTGRTPERSVYVQIRRANARRVKSGRPPLFMTETREGRVLYHLNRRSQP